MEDFRELPCNDEKRKIFEGDNWRITIGMLSTGLHMCITEYEQGIAIRPSKQLIEKLTAYFFTREGKELSYETTSHISPKVVHIWERTSDNYLEKMFK